MEVEIKIYDETLKIQVEAEELDRFIRGLYKKDNTIDESKWKVHPFYANYEVHPEGYVRHKDTKVLLEVRKYRKEPHHKPQFNCTSIFDEEGNHTVGLHKLVADTFIPIPWYLQNYHYTELSVGCKDGNYEDRESIKAYNLAWYVGRIVGNTPMIKVMDLEDDKVLYFPNQVQIETFIRKNKLDPKRFNVKTE
ncbi:hypothetical protein vBSAP01_10 [Staphylococcus phage vB_SAP01]|nr:hypothetical protein vBSAP01_10 [Staphylococcus phage vB_SAP01]